MGESSTIYIRNLVKVFHRGFVRANDGIDLDVGSGDLVCLLGPNGAGKTTLIRQVMGVLKPSSGDIRLNGGDVVKSPELARDLCAYLPQSYYPFLDLTVYEAVYCSARLRGVSHEESRRRTRAELTHWVLDGKERRLLRHLSGGEKRLVGLAAALVGDRPVLVLDEPTNELDPKLRARVWMTLGQQASSGRTILLITHNVHEIEHVVSRVVILANGKVVAEGNPDRIRNSIRPANGRLSVTVPNTVSRETIAEVERVAGARFRLTAKQQIELDPSDVGDLFRLLSKDECVRLDEVRIWQPTLEDAYLHYAGETA